MYTTGKVHSSPSPLNAVVEYQMFDDSDVIDDLYQNIMMIMSMVSHGHQWQSTRHGWHNMTQ
jgi:hypothetical protein